MTGWGGWGCTYRRGQEEEKEEGEGRSKGSDG